MRAVLVMFLTLNINVPILYPVFPLSPNYKIIIRTFFASLWQKLEFQIVRLVKYIRSHILLCKIK